MNRFSVTIKDLYQTSRSNKVGTLTWGFLTLAFIVFAGLMAIFVEIVEEVGDGDTLAVDEAILRWFEGFHASWLDQFISISTDAGGVIGVIAIVVVSLGLLLWRRKYRAVLQLGMSISGAVGLNLILKNIFTRDRPDLWASIVNEASYSFPSGHAMASSALALSLILIFWQTRYRWLVTGLGVSYMLFVGASRLYLGVHYPSDVLGGWTMSAIWVIAVSMLTGALRVRRQA